MSRVIIIAALIVVVLLLVIFAGRIVSGLRGLVSEVGLNSPTPAANLSPTSAPNPITGQSDIKEFTIIARNYSFEPSDISVNRGDRVRINLINEDGFHDLLIDQFNARTPQINAGKTATIDFIADQSGTFEYYCSVGNHRSMGMVGTLTIQ